jgi:hypothetical protein
MNNDRIPTQDLSSIGAVDLRPHNTPNGVSSVNPTWVGDTWIADPSTLYPSTYTTKTWPDSYTTTTITQEDLEELRRSIDGTLESGRTRMSPSNDVSPILSDILNDI